MTRFGCSALALVAALGSLSGLASAGNPSFTYGKADELKDVKKVDWKASAQVGAILTSGNSRTTTLALGATASRKDKDNKVQLDVTAAYAKSQLILASDVNGDKVIQPEEITRVSKVTTESWAVKARYDRFFTPKNSLFVSALTSADQPAGKKLVGGGQVGYSRLLFHDDIHEIAAELGYDFSYESYVDTTVASVSIHSVRAFVGYAGKLSDATGVEASLEGLFNLNKEAGAGAGLTADDKDVAAFKDIRVNAKTAVTTKLHKNISFKFGFTAKYDEAPAPRPPFALPYATGFKPLADRLDTATEVTLIVSFL